MSRNVTQQMQNLRRLEQLLRERYRAEQAGEDLEPVDAKIARVRARIDAVQRDLPVQTTGGIRSSR